MNIELYEKRAKNTIKESTLNSRLSALRRFKEFIGEDREPTVEDVEEWVDHLLDLHERGDLTSATIRQYYKTTRYYFEMMDGNAEELDFISKRLPPERNDHGDYLDYDEWEALRKNAYSYREDAIIELMYRYGRRPGEIILLNLSDIDLDNKVIEEVETEDGEVEEKIVEKPTITFNILKKKESFRAKFELKPEPKKKLERYLKHRIDVKEKAEHPWEDGEYVDPLFTTGNGRISYDTVYVNVKKIADRAGIEKNITPKSMRHSRATHLDWEGNSPEEIARHQLIHEPDTQVIGAYIHDRDEEQVREVMSLDEEN